MSINPLLALPQKGKGQDFLLVLYLPSRPLLHNSVVTLLKAIQANSTTPLLSHTVKKYDLKLPIICFCRA